MQKKICIVYTGGTFLSENSESWRVITGKLDNVTDVAAELKRNFDFDQSQIYSIDSSDVTPENLDNLRNHILSQNATGDYTGYVVVHGTDTMEYAGSYLSLALSKLQKPVVLTWSMISVNDEWTDGFHNLHNAIVMSQQDLVGTFIMFGKNGTQANKTIKQNSDSFDAFDSPGYNHVMDVRYDTSAPEMNGKQLEALIHHFRNNTYTFSRNWDIISNLRRLFAENVKKNLATLQHLHTNVGHVKLFPGYKYTNLDQYIDEKCEWLLIEGYGDGNIPQHAELNRKLQQLLESNALVVLKSQCPQGELTHKYAGWKQLLERGAISAKNLTTGTTLMKLMLVLGAKQGNQPSDLAYAKELFAENYAGEYLK